MLQLAALFWLTAAAGIAAEEVPPAAIRFAAADTSEQPDFQRHVVPLLSRLGCNGRACHGSFQGQGGLALSLFGYDFAADHSALTAADGDAGERRVDRDDPLHSLLLRKPTLAVDHEGGQRLADGSWQFHLLHRWIEAGAPPASAPHRLARLQVEPSELLLTYPAGAASLRVVAHWRDGSSEDVTCLCRFQAADDAVVEVDNDGQVTALAHGDTHIVAFYDNGVASVPVMVPWSDRTWIEPASAARGRVDALVLNKLRQLRINPSEMCSDAEFLRRASLDITGTLPTPAEIEAFLQDPTADKRDRKIDELLQSPAYAAWWANKFCDLTGNSRFRQAEEAVGDRLAEQWFDWIYHRLRANVPYDELVAGIVVAAGRQSGQPYPDYAREMSSYLREGNTAAFAQRPTLPHFWSRRNVEQPEEKALAFAHSFLGVRLQCAQCHKHPFDQWTQDDFRQFSSVFAAITYGISPTSRSEYERIARAAGQETEGRNAGRISREVAALAEAGETIAWREVYLDPTRLPPAGLTQLLGLPVELPGDRDPRELLRRWLVQADQPYFARALVNRVWANYFHAGLVEPVDDLSLANPPSNRELLDYLARGFVEHGYDLHWLHREITCSATYQRSWRPNANNRDDRRNFSRAIPRRLPAEVIYDALKQATAADSELPAVRENLARRAVGYLGTRMAGTYQQRVFGQPDRLIACDCERSNAPSLLQSIFMQNDPLIHARLRDSGWLAELAMSGAATADRDGLPPHELLVRAAYLRTVSRPPTADELQSARQYLDESESEIEGLRDLLWALLASKEFLLNH